MKIDDTQVLQTLQVAVLMSDELFRIFLCQERQPCDICHKSRKFFCYSCHVPLASIRDLIPRLELPVKVDVVKHPGEVEGKSTAVHAKLVCPTSVDIHIYPNCPDYREERALLVFPGPESRTLEQLKCSGDGDKTIFPYGEGRQSRGFISIEISKSPNIKHSFLPVTWVDFDYGQILWEQEQLEPQVQSQD